MFLNYIIKKLSYQKIEMAKCDEQDSNDLTLH